MLTLLYTGKQQAFVFPDYELGDDREKMLDYMKEHIIKKQGGGYISFIYMRWRVQRCAIILIPYSGAI